MNTVSSIYILVIPVVSALALVMIAYYVRRASNTYVTAHRWIRSGGAGAHWTDTKAKKSKTPNYTEGLDM